MDEQHEMVLRGPGAGGSKEWVCVTCTRRILLRWPPHFQILVLDQGDLGAVHAGGKGGVSMGSAEVSGITARDVLPGEVPCNDIHWLHENGIEWDGLSA
jgi:hypothetical protein